MLRRYSIHNDETMKSLFSSVLLVILVNWVCCEKDAEIDSLLARLGGTLKERKAARGLQLKDAKEEDMSMRGLLIEGLHALSDTEKRDHVEPFQKDWSKYDCDTDYVALRKKVNSLFSRYCREYEAPSVNDDSTCVKESKQCPDTEACCKGLKCQGWFCRKDDYKPYDIWNKVF